MGIDMNTEQERAAFEVWHLERYGEPAGQYTASGFYIDHEIQGEWRGWQARAALQSQDAERIQAAARDIFVRAGEIGILYGTNKETEGLVKAAIRLAYLVGLTEKAIDRIEGKGE